MSQILRNHNDVKTPNDLKTLCPYLQGTYKNKTIYDQEKIVNK